MKDKKIQRISQTQIHSHGEMLNLLMSMEALQRRAYVHHDGLPGDPVDQIPGRNTTPWRSDCIHFVQDAERL